MPTVPTLPALPPLPAKLTYTAASLARCLAVRVPVLRAGRTIN